MTNGLSNGLTKASKPYGSLTHNTDPFFGNSLFDDIFRPFWDRGSTKSLSTTQRTGTANIVRHEDHYTAEVDMPGLTRDDIDIELRDDVLHIEGKKEVEDETEYRSRRYTQKIMVGSEIETDNIEATYENGVLLVNLPLKEDYVESGSVRKIEIR